MLFILIKKLGSFLVKKTQVMSQQNTASWTYCFYCFSPSFVLLFAIVLHQLCLLHQVGAKNWSGSNLPKASQQCAPPVLDDVSLGLLPKATATKYILGCYYIDPYKCTHYKLFVNISNCLFGYWSKLVSSQESFVWNSVHTVHNIP